MRNYLEEKMMHISMKMLQAKQKAKANAAAVLTDERGDTNFVSIMLIIVVVIALAALFRDTLMEVAENVLGQLTEFVGS